jgi:hypothetical protein
MITTDTSHQDLGPDHYLRHHDPARRRRHLTAQLEQLGSVTLTPIPEAA